MEVGEYGDRTTVTALVPRSMLSLLCAHLHRLLGVDVRGYTASVLLPADTRSFGLVAGASGKPAQGVIENLPKDAFRIVHVRSDELWDIPISCLGVYFGWSDPRGVRVQFHTHTGETYAVTITYDVLPGHDEVLRFFPLIEALLRQGEEAVAMNLTEKAAEAWKPTLPWFQRVLYTIRLRLKLVPPRLCFSDVQLVDPPPRERSVSTGASPAELPARLRKPSTRLSK
jgi:hypothetical protein